MMKLNKLTAVICIAALGATIFASCSKGEATTIISGDVISAPDIVQQTMAQVAGNGKTYAYTWNAEDVDAKMEKMEEELRNAVPVSVASTKEDNPNPLTVEEQLKYQRDKLQEEHDLERAVSPQEAANIIGTILEEQYGFDLTDKSIGLYCYQSDIDMLYHLDGGGPLRTEWGGLVEIDNGTWFPISGSVGIDAFTGEVIDTNYYLDQDTREEAFSTEMPDYLTQAGELITINKNAPSFKETEEKMVAKIKTSLSGSLILSGSEIETMQFMDDTNIVGGEGIIFTTKAGKEGVLRWTYHTPNYDFGGYPLRAFSYFNSSYFKK